MRPSLGRPPAVVVHHPMIADAADGRRIFGR
jgi:hypothetical protein